MGLNEFVSLFYGSAQSLHGANVVVGGNSSSNSSSSSSSSNSKSASTSTYSLPTVADVKEFRQMLKNHKNVQAKKYSYKDYPNDMKYGKSLNASQIYAAQQHQQQQQQQQQQQPPVAVSKKLLSANNKKNNNNNSSSQNYNNHNVVGKAGKEPPATRIPTKLAAAATCSSSSGGSSSNASGNNSDMDAQRGKHKSATSASSFLWNSFRLPRRQKPQAASASEKKQRPAESLRSGADQTELKELGLDLLLTTSSKRASLGNELACCLCGTTSTSSGGCSCAAEKAPKLQSVEQLETEVQSLGMASTNEELFAISSTATLQAEDNPADYPALKRFMTKGVLQHERLAKYLETSSGWKRQSECQTLGLAIVVQLMAEQMDTLSSQEIAAKSSLNETIALLQKTQQSCEELRQQLHEKDLEWTQRQQEREHLHRCELQEAQDNVQEVQMLAKERFRELENQLLAKDEEKKQALQTYHGEVAHQLRHKQQQLAAAEKQIIQLQALLQEQESRQQELHEQLTRKDNTHVSRVAECAEREEELQKRIKSLTKELETLQASTEHKERDLRGRLAMSEDEVSVLRNSSQQRSPSSSLNDSSAELWQREAESLRYVLDMKQDKIADLSKENAELKRETEEQRGLSSRLAMLEAQNEMLRTELEAKTEKEKDMQRQMEEMQKAFNHESIKRKRLTCDKEELQYHLKQRSEQLQLLQAQLHEQLFNSSQDSSLNQSYTSARFSLDSLQNAPHSSPPTSPVIKGVIERNDSVSWVLEMDDETPQVAASKLVRRAGSLRNSSERSPTQRRQLSQSANAATNGHGQNGHSNGPNPLSQSMSATMLLPNHSGEPESPQPPARARSRSVSTKAMDTAVTVGTPASQRQRPNSETTLPDWHADELCSSSPQSASAHVELRARSSSAAMKLMSSMDGYPKALKKFQEIQESAGEAMVSGANSEDESCSASSDDMRSSSASSTASAAGCTLSKRSKQPSRMSIEEALMIEPINSLNGTPMEVSWSEDAADAEAAATHPLA